MKKRILVIDNDKNYSNMLVGWLRDLDYEPTACASLEEAKERIAQEYYHVLMVDIRMKDDSDPDDFSGFQIIQNENYRSIPKIISTSHREAAFHEMWGDQVTNREDVYFISKSDDSQVRRGLLEQVFAKVEDDFDLRFRFNERTAVSFYHLTSHLFTQEPTERLPAYSVIFEALLRRIFHGNRQVTLNRIYCVEKDTLTMSAYCYGSGLVVQPTGYLVHFGRREVVSEGVKRNPRQVQYHPQSQPLLGNPSTLAETHGLAAVAYEFLNVELEGVQTLEQVIGETNHEQLRSLLSTLKETYFDNLHPRSAKKRPVKDLAIYYDELLTQTHGNNLLKRLEQNIGSLCRKFADTAIASLIIDNKSLLVDHLQTDPTVFEEVVSIHPGDALPGNMRWHLSYNGLTAQKILVARGSQPHPVRFSQIALAPSAHDYATLELIFRQDWRLGSQVDQLLALENQLAADLGQPDLTPKQAETLSPEEDAIQSICHIRKLALQNGTDHVSHYKRCLRYLTLFPLLGFEPDYFYSSRELRYYLHLLLLLAHLSQPAPAQTSGAAAINWSEHKVRLNGRWHQLSKPEFAVFHYLWERMGQVCSIKMLYDCYRRAQYPASQLEDRENPSPRDMQATTQTVISRLRQKLKANKNWPIETVRSSGYKLVELTIE